MTPTIAILAERIHRILKAGNITRNTNWDDRDFQYLIRDEAAKQVKGMWYESRKEGEKHVDSRFVSTFLVEVQKNDNTDENYCMIPVSNWLNFPDGTGIESVRPDIEKLTSKKTKGKEFRAFIPIPHRFEDIYLGLPSGALEGQFGWKLRKDKILFTKRYDKSLLDDGIPFVEMDIVTVDPKAIAVNDVLPLPAELVDGLIRNILALYGIVDQKAQQLMAQNA